MALELTSNNFKSSILDEEKLVLVDFWADWCGPCRAVAPLIDALDERYENLVVGKINVDEEAELAEEYRVSSIPTVMFFKDGVVVERMVGAHQEEDYQNIIEAYLKSEEDVD